MSKGRAPIIGDWVVDLTAYNNNWPDWYGQIIELAGDVILVQYPSGSKRSKLASHIQIIPSGLSAIEKIANAR